MTGRKSDSAAAQFGDLNFKGLDGEPLTNSFGGIEIFWGNSTEATSGVLDLNIATPTLKSRNLASFNGKHYSSGRLPMATETELSCPPSWVTQTNGHSITREKRSIIDIHELLNSDNPALLIVFPQGQESFVTVVGDVLGQPFRIVTSRRDVQLQERPIVVGICLTDFTQQWISRDQERIVINAHCVDRGHQFDESLTPLFHYEYMYTAATFYRRDLARYLSFILGQISPHEDLSKKERTTLLSTTFPDVNAALSNLEILSVGADSVELRVDLLEDRLPDGSFRKVPSLKYVGEQVMTLRQRTELPIIFTTRCTNENGRFPMDDPSLFYHYLYKAIQWGCEYIDMELWLPEDIRRLLSDQKGSSKIISAFHDFSGQFKWTSPEATELFQKGTVFGDVVKMIVYVNSMQENYELEYFRSLIQSKYSHPPLSGLNMGRMGQISRSFNKIFTPITHPLLPMVAAPGQLSAAEINQSLHGLGEMPKLDFYGIGANRSKGQDMFFEKCFNELSLPHQIIHVHANPNDCIDSLLKRPNFGGAYLNPPLTVSKSGSISLSNSAKATGLIDTVFLRSDGSQNAFVGENASWKGIRATLTRDYVPSAYNGRAALVLASHQNDAASAIFALKSLDIAQIFTIGFKPRGSFASDLTPVKAVEDLRNFNQPSVVISALPAEKSLLAGPLLKHYSSTARKTGPSGAKVFVDVVNGPKKGDPLAIAASLGWAAYGVDDVNAWTTVETLRLLVGQNVPYDFVRLASGQATY